MISDNKIEFTQNMWEYIHATAPCTSIDHITKFLNGMGSAGWEVASRATTRRGNPPTFYFKRLVRSISVSTVNERNQ